MRVSKLILAGAVIGLLAVAVAGCDPDDPPASVLSVVQREGGDALDRYVAIGDAMTAGFMDGGLIQTGQLASYPAQIAGRILPDDRLFVQPLVAYPGIGVTDLGDDDLVAGVLRWDGQTIAPAGVTDRDVVADLLLAPIHPVPYQNLGVPGATLTDAIAAVDGSTSQQPDNSYFDFILRNPAFGDVVMVDQAVAQGPTLATVWLGLSELQAAGRSGQPQVGVNVAPGEVMAGQLAAALQRLVAGVEARFGYAPYLVVGNLPPITALPYFIPKSVFDAAVGVAYPALEDEVTHVLFPWLGEIQGGFSDPLPAEATLTVDEIAVLDGVQGAFNAALDDLAAAMGFAVADIAEALASLLPVQQQHFALLLGQGQTVEQAAALTVYSLDGLHLNGHGHRVAANAFIDAINEALDLTGAQAVDHVPYDSVWDPTYPSP